MTTKLQKAYIYIQLWLNTLTYIYNDNNLIKYTNQLSNIFNITDTQIKQIINDFINYFYIKQNIHEISYSLFNRLDNYSNNINFKNIQNLSKDKQNIIKQITCQTFYKLCDDNELFENLQIKKIIDHDEFYKFLTRPQHYC